MGSSLKFKELSPEHGGEPGKGVSNAQRKVAFIYMPKDYLSTSEKKVKETRKQFEWYYDAESKEKNFETMAVQSKQRSVKFADIESWAIEQAVFAVKTAMA